MKKHFTLLVLCFLVATGYSQKFEITSDNPHFIKIKASSPIEDKQATVLLKNISKSDQEIYWSTKFMKGTEEWHWHVCDYNKCYSYLVKECPADAPVVVSKNSTVGFIFALEDSDLAGAARYEFCFWVKGEKVSSRQCVEVNFNEVVMDAVSDITHLDAIKVFPNPATEFFSLTDASGIGSVEIYSLLGRKIKTFNVTQNGSYNISDLQEGLYFTHLINAKGRKVKSMSLRVQ